MSDVPEWVKVWAWYRQTHGNHDQPFPQQLEAHEFTWARPPVDYPRLVGEWRDGPDEGSAFLEFLKDAA